MAYDIMDALDQIKQEISKTNESKPDEDVLVVAMDEWKAGVLDSMEVIAENVEFIRSELKMAIASELQSMLDTIGDSDEPKVEEA